MTRDLPRVRARADAVSRVCLAIVRANHHHLMRRATMATARLTWVDLWFTEETVGSYPAIWATDAARGRAFKLELMRRGIWSPPGLKMFLSLAHSDGDIARTLDAAEAAMRTL